MCLCGMIVVSIGVNLWGIAEALRSNIAIFKERHIHLKETSLPLDTNVGKGGMKALVEVQWKANVERRTCWIGLACLQLFRQRS